MLRILGVVPARGGSKRIPRKNLQEIEGVPLVVRAMNSARQAARLTRWVVSSEDPEILALARSMGQVYALERPDDLAGDLVPGWAVLRHARSVCEATDPPYDVIVMLPPTAPFRTGEDIDATISLLEVSGAPSATSVAPVPHDMHPLKMKFLVNGFLDPVVDVERGRTMVHQLPSVYVRNGAVYASRVAVIARGQTLDERCAAYIMPRERSVDVNEPIDLELARLMAARGLA